MIPASRIKRFFEDFHNYLEKNGLLHAVDLPDAFYYVNETNFELNPSMRRILSSNGAKTVYKVNSSRPKEKITVALKLMVLC